MFCTVVSMENNAVRGHNMKDVKKVFNVRENEIRFFKVFTHLHVCRSVHILSTANTSVIWIKERISSNKKPSDKPKREKSQLKQIPARFSPARIEYIYANNSVSILKEESELHLPCKIACIMHFLVSRALLASADETRQSATGTNGRDHLESAKLSPFSLVIFQVKGSVQRIIKGVNVVSSWALYNFPLENFRLIKNSSL